MKKNTIKAFTLVEMLIVIVIIGILIASLMPRMQTAQGRARDVARKNDLSQIQTAIITSQSDRKVWPGMDAAGSDSGASGANDGITVDAIADDLKDAGMSSVPADPNGSNVVYGLGSTSTSTKAGQYIYMVGKRNGVANAGFALMAKTEVEGSSNWVVCGESSSSDGVITSDMDLAEVTLCENVQKGSSSASDGGGCSNQEGVCTYSETGQLRYLLLY